MRVQGIGKSWLVRWVVPAAASLTLIACAAPGGGGEADLVLRGGKIVTLDDALGDVEALAVRDGIVVAAGSDDEIDAMIGADTRVIELDGRTAVPGFVEGHGHFTGIGRSLMNIDLRAARSWDEIVETIAAVAAERGPDEWILGWGWHQDKWDSAPRSARA